MTNKKSRSRAGDLYVEDWPKACWVCAENKSKGDNDVADVLEGPVRSTPRRAIKAWNRLWER